MDKHAEDYIDEASQEDMPNKPLASRQWRIARAIVELVRTLKYRQLGIEEKSQLWHDIQHQWQRETRLQRHRRLLRLVAWSAAASVVLAAGMLFYRYHKDTSHALLASSERIPLETLAQGGAPALRIGSDSAISLANISSIRFGNGTLETIDEAGNKNQLTAGKTDAYSSISVPYGQRTLVELPDGTQVTLNSGSVLTFPSTFSEDKREVSLRGEGFFEVTPRPDHPFYVYTDDIQIKVLGTSFNVSAYPDENELGTYLVEGQIELAPLAHNRFEKRILKKGNFATFNKRQGRLALANQDVENHIAWTQKRLVLQSVPLANILRKLERCYNVEIELAAAKNKDDQFSGVLDLQRPIQAVLRDIMSDETPKIKQKGRRIIIE
ncbi:FecR family protein [Parapedobacter koreensis]|uniref:FecR family protein n=1 Tax=Parapedobacter koreensis TaxID=332977 RepID=A0A1H7Q260_9SPHI|nr:FecR domain-containing protein [Parapedobacter koreensis]SEL42053.1 FecR family protein [Parapedobacter koreensis]